MSFNTFIAAAALGMHCAIAFAHTPAYTAGSAPLPTAIHDEAYRLTTSSPLGMLLLPRTSSGTARLAYAHEGGRLMRVQSPEKEDGLHLTSRGLYSTSRWQLYGEFAYTRTYADSVAWLLSETPEDGLPYYFASPRKGNFDLEKYELKGTFAADAGRHFTAGASADVVYSKGARGNDPRSATESFVSRYYAFFGIKTSALAITAMGGLGYGTRDNDIVYNNSDNDRPLRPDMMAYEFMGFGLNRRTQQYQNRTLMTDINSAHAALQASLQTSSLRLWARGEYTGRKNKIRRSRITNVEESTLTTYFTTGYSLTLGADYRFESGAKLQTIVYAKAVNGHDKLVNILQGQKNYIYSQSSFGANATLAHRAHLFGAALSYSREKRNEGSSEHIYEQKALDASLSWTARRELRGCFLLYGASQGLVLPTATLQYPPLQENIFTTHVALPMLRYHNTSQGHTALRLGAGRAVGSTDVALSLDYRMAYSLGSRTDAISGTRHHVSAAVTLTF